MEQYYITNTNRQGLPSGLLVKNNFNSGEDHINVQIMCSVHEPAKLMLKKFLNADCGFGYKKSNGTNYATFTIPTGYLTPIESDQYTGKTFYENEDLYMVVQRVEHNWRCVNISGNGYENDSTRLKTNPKGVGHRFYFFGKDFDNVSEHIFGTTILVEDKAEVEKVFVPAIKRIKVSVSLEIETDEEVSVNLPVIRLFD